VIRPIQPDRLHTLRRRQRSEARRTRGRQTRAVTPPCGGLTSICHSVAAIFTCCNASRTLFIATSRASIVARSPAASRPVSSQCRIHKFLIKRHCRLARLQYELEQSQAASSSQTCLRQFLHWNRRTFRSVFASNSAKTARSPSGRKQEGQCGPFARGASDLSASVICHYLTL